MASVTDDAVVQEVGRPLISWWQVLRVVLVLGWVAWASFSWWSAPRESTTAQVRADVAAQRVESFEWGERWSGQRGFQILNPLRSGLESGGDPGSILLWHTRDGRQHYAHVDSSDEARALDAELTTADSGFPATAVVAGLGIAGAALFLWALLSGPDPVTGTKWFWFWLVSGLPLGLGLLWWLARERPWSSRAAPRTGPAGEDRRLRWWVAFVTNILAGFAVSLLLLGLHSLLGDGVVPVHD